MHSMLEASPVNHGMEVAPDRTLPEVYYQQYPQYKPYEESQHIQQAQLAAHNGGTTQGTEISRLKRTTFWLLVALIAVMALALGLGTGLGLGLRNNNSQKSTGTAVESVSGSTSAPAAASTTSSSTTDGATSTTASSTSTSTSSSTQSAAEATPTSLIDSGCPGTNGSTLTQSQSSITYNVYCNSDLTGSDLASLVVNSLEECLTVCDSLNWTQKRKDVGSVWNEQGVVGQTAGTCWCKGGNSIKVTAKPGIVVASPVPQ
ncbi:uncharacterized protein F4822DRAFT_385266 [Hypoxylon trugodes]|uniref:uncharacterized protein n=1 Tax=Hypoxylon trugodes TaxID=326681 RepID=UPI0021934F73|nr:uncharacterized protein F4822DRAFT_385266 [Hypoxylon trugodes]KAI1393622.1 hypothetical protein F4822DRAFT_385266 [Hypoxylon trugodes]